MTYRRLSHLADFDLFAASLAASHLVVASLALVSFLFAPAVLSLPTSLSSSLSAVSGFKGSGVKTSALQRPNEKGGEGQQQQLQADEEFKGYINRINRMEYEDILSNLNSFLSGQTGVAHLDREVKGLNRIRQYEELKDAVRGFYPYIQVEPTRDTMDYSEDESDEDSDEDNDDDDDRMSKRAMERVDKEDDWLGGDYEGLFDPLAAADREEALLSSRRRNYPTTEDSYREQGQGEEVAEEDQEQQQQEEVLSGAHRRLSKKDLESLVYQANPALTVHQLSPEPQISFRKFHQEQDMREDEEDGDDDVTTTEATTTMTTTTEKAAVTTTERPSRKGMKEMLLLRPIVKSSSANEMSEEEEERQLEGLIVRKN